MSENLPNIDDLFRKALDAHDEVPSANAWANIDKSLDKKKVIYISKKYKNLKWAAAALLIFSAGMAMYTWNTRIRNKELVKQNEIDRKKASRTLGSARAYTPTNPANKPYKQSAPPPSANRITPTLPIDPAKGDTKQDRTITTKPATDVVGGSNDPKNLIPGPLSRTGSKGANDLVSSTGKPVKRSQKDLRNSYEANSRDQKRTWINSIGRSNLKNSGVPGEDHNKLAVKNEPAFEDIKRNIVVTIVPRQETDLTSLQPPMLHLDRASPLQVQSTYERYSAANNTASKKSSIKPRFGSKFSATIFYSQDFVSSHVQNDQRAFREDDRNEIKTKENISNTTSKGMLVNYKLANDWSIQSGMSFSSITTDIQPKTIFARPDNRGNINYRFNCSAGYSFVTLKSSARPAAGDSIQALSSKNVLHYLGVPFSINYTVFKGRFTLQPGAGLTANFLTSGKIETSLAGQWGNEKKSIDHIEGLNSSYINGSISLAANYNFTKNFALSFTPVSRFALGAINKDAPVKTYINSFGLAAGLQKNDNI